VTGYADTLGELWRAHVAPRADDAPTVVSLFAGCGGSSLGYSSAGYREVLAADRDAHACAVFRANFPGVPVHQGDIAQLDPGELRLPAAGLDLLDASPPCQAYSMTGLRRAADPRGQLWTEVIRLAAAWQPKVIVIENVPGLVRSGCSSRRSNQTQTRRSAP
jgi:DNA (cytosine-5)-methyltransferase 1